LSTELEGYIIDLLDELSRNTSITFEVKAVPDGKYGSLKEDGKWSGMIGQLVDNVRIGLRRTRHSSAHIV